MKLQALIESPLALTPRMVHGAAQNKSQVLIELDPTKFLELTSTADFRQEMKQFTKKLDVYNAAVKQGEILVMPFLVIKFDRNRGKVVGHEGRHRAAALLAHGENKMIVALQLRPTEQYSDDLFNKYKTKVSKDARMFKGDEIYHVNADDLPPIITGQYNEGTLTKQDYAVVKNGWENLLNFRPETEA